MNFNAAPAAGNYDFRFRLAVDGSGNNFTGTAFLTNGVPVTNGLFLTTLDFGAGVFTGVPLWLQIEVKSNGTAVYAQLNPLQPFTPTPYAVFATTASNVSGTVSATQITGTLANTLLPGSPNFSGTVAATSFTGNGANVTNVNATALNGLTGANLWKTAGNTGTTNGNFLGTLDNQPLELRVNNARAWRAESAPSNAVNVIGGYAGNYALPGVFGAGIGSGGAGNIAGVAYSNSVGGNLAGSAAAMRIRSRRA